MIRIDLTWPEVWLAVNSGVMRRMNAVRHERAEPYGARPTAAWNDDINGCLAELALAKHMGVFWSGTVGRLDLPDVGLLQVRSKQLASERLVVRRSDKDHEVFVSVQVGVPVCYLCGWMYGREAKREEWLLPAPGKPDRFFVPNVRLRGMDTLVKAGVLVAA